MITKNQIEYLSKQFNIDEFTIMREYLQLLFLSYLYRIKEGKSIYFKGGTAIRLLFDSSRFSEDLDFSIFFDKDQMIKIVKKLEKLIQKEIPNLHILLLYSGEESLRFRITYQSSDFKYPLIIRLDFHHEKEIGKSTVSPLISQFPIQVFPLITHLTKEAILTEKIRALLTRNKGRDLFDVWYLLKKGIKLEIKINKELILKKISQYSQSNLDRDLAQFLPKSQREVTGMLKEKLINQINQET